MDTKDGLEGDEDSVARLAQQRGFDKCPVCWTLVVYDAVVTECAHKFCANCLSTLSAQSFSFTCPSCRMMCLTVKTIPAKNLYREIKFVICTDGIRLLTKHTPGHWSISLTNFPRPVTSL